MKRLLLDIFYIILFCIIWYSAIRIWYWYDAKNGPNILFQKKPNIDSLEAAIQDLPKDVKFLIFQLTGCGLIFYFIFYFSSFIATGKGFLSGSVWFGTRDARTKTVIPGWKFEFGTDDKTHESNSTCFNLWFDILHSPLVFRQFWSTMARFIIFFGDTNSYQCCDQYFNWS